MLQAIEDEQFNQLPGGIFNKGFIRAYARFLGLDEEETLAEYLKASGNDIPVPAETGLHESLSADAASQRGMSRDRVGKAERNETARKGIEINVEAEAANFERQLPWGIFAALLLVTALTLSVWNRFERGHVGQTPAADSLSSSPALVAPAKAEPREPEIPASALRKSVTPTAAAYIQNSADNGSGGSRADGTSGVETNEFSLLIQARRESWITITADGKPLVSELMVAGSERMVRGRDLVTVKAGNSGAVDFEMNGKKLGTGGEYGQVKTTTFGPQGII